MKIWTVHGTNHNTNRATILRSIYSEDSVNEEDIWEHLKKEGIVRGSVNAYGFGVEDIVEVQVGSIIDEEVL